VTLDEFLGSRDVQYHPKKGDHVAAFHRIKVPFDALAKQALQGIPELIREYSAICGLP
jgi:hypothetical protein